MLHLTVPGNTGQVGECLGRGGGGGISTLQFFFVVGVGGNFLHFYNLSKIVSFGMLLVDKEFIWISMYHSSGSAKRRSMKKMTLTFKSVPAHYFSQYYRKHFDENSHFVTQVVRISDNTCESIIRDKSSVR